MTHRHPALFIGHGSPLQAIEPSRYSAAWQQLGRSLPRPRAILAVSAHWYTQGTAVTLAPQPRTIHDFYGFPQPMYQLQYPARGDASLAARVQSLLAPTVVHADSEWGLDHGSWVVLQYMYPEANIPTIQLSIDAALAPRAHYQLGRQLRALRDEGVLLLGSGNVVHNLRALQRSATAPAPDWATQFNDALRAAVLAGDHESLIEYHELGGATPAGGRQGSAARLCVPTPEHYLPLLYVLGAQAEDDAVSIPVDGIDLGAISMLSVQLGG
jgi:4,5-DOPA dioxygenase extradiol